MALQAFLNDPKVRKLYIGRVKAHAKADEIIQGSYWEGGKGCAVGCTIHGSDHSKYETELGIPMELAYLQDALFEALPAAEAKTFPAEFLGAIKTGADLSKVWDKFHVWLLVDDKDGVINCADSDEVKGWIKNIAVLFECAAAGMKPTQEQEDVAAWDARAARAAWAAWDARDARAARAAWAAWDARDVSILKTVRKQCAKLIELLQSA